MIDSEQIAGTMVIAHAPGDMPVPAARAMALAIAAAICKAVAAERAKWVAACWEAYAAGYKDQGWTVLYEMGATDEAPK